MSAIGCTVRPSIRASGRAARTFSSMVLAASFTFSGSASPSITPPTSDLWVMSGERILSATGLPIARQRTRRLVGARHDGRRHHRDAVRGEHLLRLDLGEPRTPLPERALEHRLRPLRSGSKASGMEGGTWRSISWLRR